MGMMEGPAEVGEMALALAETGLNPLLSFEQGRGRAGEEKKKRT